MRDKRESFALLVLSAHRFTLGVYVFGNADRQRQRGVRIRMWFRRLLMMVLLVSVAGCATGPAKEGEPPELVQPAVPAAAADIASQLGRVRLAADKALVYLYRPKRYVGSANVYRITINGTAAADMKVGTRLPYPVPPGRVTLQGRSLPGVLNIGLALGLMEKPSIAFDAAAGKVYFIDVKTGFAGGPQFEFVDAPAALEAVKGLKTAAPPAPGKSAK
ncbi:MAG: DUF2846 domain-containing protein [Gammaproteobacteria bacterium]